MKAISLTLTLALAAVFAGCATSERSRTLGNPAVPPTTTAQQVCSNCHGLDGNSVSPNFPRLAAQQEAYIVAQLSQFRSHNRSDPAGFIYMWGLSKHLTDDQIKGLAAYFAAQKSSANAAGDATLMAQGKEIFEKGIPSSNIPPCATCHGADATGNGTFPRLAGQHADYLIKQLNVFQKTEQRPEGAVMKTITHLLTPDNMTAVATYLQGFPSR
jgi:cytochrome c553